MIFCLLFNSEEEQKSVDIESICQLLDIVMGSTFRPQVDYFIDYLKVSSSLTESHTFSLPKCYEWFCVCLTTDTKRLQSHIHGSMDGLLQVLQWGTFPISFLFPAWHFHQLTSVWNNLQISFPDMSEYNPGLAWPLLLNNFVEWIREKQAWKLNIFMNPLKSFTWVSNLLRPVFYKPLFRFVV